MRYVLTNSFRFLRSIGTYVDSTEQKHLGILFNRNLRDMFPKYLFNIIRTQFCGIPHLFQSFLTNAVYFGPDFSFYPFNRVYRCSIHLPFEMFQKIEVVGGQSGSAARWPRYRSIYSIFPARNLRDHIKISLARIMRRSSFLLKNCLLSLTWNCGKA